MNVLVTGHLGYIGSVLCPHLADAGHQVSGFDSGWFADCTLGPAFSSRPDHHLDLRELTPRHLEGFDAVVHLGSLCNDPLSDLNPDLTWDINFAASLRLAELSKQAGASRFLLSSSCSMYGASGDDFVTEEAALQPLTVYAEAKVRLERSLKFLADDSFSPVYLRNATAYGWSPRPRLDLVLNSLVASALTTGRVLLRSDGSPWRPLVHVEDISRAFLAALEAPRTAVHNVSLNVGVSEHNYQMRELAEFVREAVPGSRIEYAPGAGPDKRCYRVNFDKIKKVLPAFQPRWSPRAGAQELCTQFLKYGLTCEEAEGPRYKRLEWIRKQRGDQLLDDNLRWTHRVAAATS
jgi:nucleoside-diphosphate-sugar epimerase